ncbi:hypothetical protein BDN71DRAFT_1505699 [Pleurotus eryngii]|uniref:Uncharacterized protein n=1 Tax=Pleurotus eryngii TaxID=5323 RepID=A0A9P5ZZN5_PLEER|nr:hypothetical protein BDN71DRAFT_1505699 [Pleurotus eryngii]
MTTRPGYLRAKERPSSAIYIGADNPVLSPPSLPDLPEPPSPVSSVGSRGSGLPSPPATNSTGSGSTGGDNDRRISHEDDFHSRRRPFSMNSLNETNIKAFQDAMAANLNRDGIDDDEDDDHNDGEGEEDNTARLDRMLSIRSSNQEESALQRVKSLTERNRMTLNKITAFSRLSSPSPAPSQRRRSPPPANSVSSSSSSSHTASTRQSASASTSSLARSSTNRPRTSDSSTLHGRSQSYAYDLTPEHLSGSETERESTSQYTQSSSSRQAQIDNLASAGSTSRVQLPPPSSRPYTPPPAQRRRLTSAPSSPARVRDLATSSSNIGLSSRTRSPRKRISMALSAPDPDNNHNDNRYERDEDNLRGSGTNSRVGFVDHDNPMYDDTGQRLGGRVPSRTSTFGRRTSRQPLPREFRDNAYDISQEDDTRMSRQHSLDGSIANDSGVDVSSGRSASRASGQLPTEPPTPHRSHYPSQHVQQSPRRATNQSSMRDPQRRQQTRWLPGDVSFADDQSDLTTDIQTQHGRRQSLRGGSAESALGLGSGRSLVGEGLRAAGLTKRDVPEPVPRRTTRESHEIDSAVDRGGRPQSRLSGSTSSNRYSDSFRPSSRAHGQLYNDSDFRPPEHPSGADNARRVATAPRAATSMASYRASFDGTSSANHLEADNEEEPRTAPLLRTYRSSLGLENSRAGSALGRAHPERHSSPFGSTRRREDGGRTMGGASSRELGKHAELMKHSLHVFASNLERLGLTETSGPAVDLVKSAEDIVGASERLNELMKSGTNRALTEQIDAEVGGNSSSDVDLVEVWRSVGGQWRDGLRVSDELVRSVTSFLLGVGRVVKELGGETGGGYTGDTTHGRSMSLDEEALARAAMDSEVTTSSGASGRRSVGSSRQSWEPPPKDREWEREETLKKLAGGDCRHRESPMPRPGSGLRNARTQRESPLPQRASVLRVFNTDRQEVTATPIRAPAGARKVGLERQAPSTVPSSSMRQASNFQDSPMIGKSESLETVHGYEPSPTPASRTQNPSDRIQPLTHRALTASALNALNNSERNTRAGLSPLAIPPPLPKLKSESPLQRSHTIATDRSTTKPERERRHKQATASTSTIRPQFPVTHTNPTTALSTHSLTASPEDPLFPISRSNSERSGRSDAARPHASATFSRPSTGSTALTGLRDIDQRQRTISNSEEATDEPKTNGTTGPSTRAVKAVARVYGPMTPSSGSETERDTRRKTIGIRQGGRPSLEGDIGPGWRSGQSTIGQGTLPATTGRARRQTVTSLFDQS